VSSPAPWSAEWLAAGMSGVRIEAGRVVHPRDCKSCDGAGLVVTSGGIPALGTDWEDEAPCEECDGTGRVADEDCDCDLCIQVAEDLEARRAE
jgi:DnaJ-class molecular chaperone